MIANLPPYPAYKPSGVEWLGDVPAHWEVRRLKVHVTNIADQTNELGSDEIYLALENIESWTGKLLQNGNMTSFDSQVKRFQIGDVLFGKLRPYLAKVTSPSRNGVCVGEFLVLRCRVDNLLSSYLERLLRSKPAIDAIDASTFGAKMPRADWQFIGSMKFPLPSLAEQHAIVRYLAHVDRRIQRYIEAKEKLIALLQEARQSIIQRAVTRGLDPDVSLKPSGADWLGDVPAHWEVRRLRYLIDGDLTYGANAAAEYDDSTWPRYLRITDFATDGTLRDDTFRSLPPEMAKDYLVQSGDLLLARSGATVGKAFLVTSEIDQACHAGYLIRARPKHSLIEPKFLFAFTQSSVFTNWKDSTFIISTIQNISAEKYANLTVPTPPLEEQKRIIAHLDRTTAAIDAAIDNARCQTKRMAEYRASLIAHVVTGKLDVRAAAAQLPADSSAETPVPEQEKIT